jgi:hypothetical protein
MSTTISTTKSELPKFYAHLEGLVAAALREKDKQLHEATKEREHWRRLEATKSHVECDNLKQRIAALEHGESLAGLRESSRNARMSHRRA